MDDNRENVPSSEEEVCKKEERRHSIIYWLIILGFLIFIGYCAYKSVPYFVEERAYKREIKELKEEVGDISEEHPAPDVAPEEYIDMPDYVVPVYSKWAETFDGLKNKNNDAIGWIKINDTPIDYPVMFAPDEENKYLHLNFEGKYQYRGLPFLAENTVIGHKGDMYSQTSNYLVFGHNMNDGTSFAYIPRYLKESFGLEHNICYFNIEYEEGIYQLMGVCLTKVYTEETDEFEFYDYSGVLTIEKFREYVKWVKANSRYETGVTADFGDQLLTLSTCYRVHDPEGRIIAVFKKIN